MAEGDEDKDKTITELRREATTLRRRLGEAEAALATEKEGHAKELADAKTTAAAEARKALAAEHTKALVSAELRVAAAKVLADPEDAVVFLRDKIDGGDLANKDGTPDKAAVTKALGDLAEAKPHLRAKAEGNGAGGNGTGGQGQQGQQGQHRPSGDGDQGPRPQGSASPNAAMNALIRQRTNR